MEVLIALFYILFSLCVIYPPVEFVSAGFTIPQIFDNFLGSESRNFVRYHMKRMSITVLIHSALPLGYVVTLWCGGERGNWIPMAASLSLIVLVLTFLQVLSWWQYGMTSHPLVKCLQPYVTPEIDWRVVAFSIDTEFNNVDKLIIPLSSISKLIVTRTWLIKVSQYSVNMVKQSDCAMVATATDNHILSTTGEDEVQYVNIKAIPSRSDLKAFSFRVPTASLRELQPRLEARIRVPDHISLMPTLIERFIIVFKQQVEQNPAYIVDEELELCIGCMQNRADVKLNRQCRDSDGHYNGDDTPCQQCNCRALWCCSCMARWWATRAGGPPASWLEARGSCPVCRAAFCLLDVCPVRAPRS